MGFPNVKPTHDAPIYIPSAASVLYEPGDLIYESAGVAYPASSQADQASEPANQYMFARNFVGICNSQKLASDAGTTPISVSVGVDAELVAASDTYTYGDLVGADEASSGTALEDQQVKKVTSRAAAIGVVVKTTAAGATKVWVRLFGTFSNLVRVSDLLSLAQPQTINMADAQVALVFGTAAAGEVKLTSNVLYVDANSGTTEDLLLPPEADSKGLVLIIANTGGEDIVVKDDGDAVTVTTLSATETGVFVCDGNASVAGVAGWRGGVLKTT